ncbi:hypothetical protein [Campylobacter majalis]|uniref:hypothetical protein n=1 Tax=Campylobacter majalis TaxID=2790656 RepID=UPI003D6851D6
MLGTSRAEYYNPDHAFFDKPSYNFALSGESIYEANQNLKWAVKQNKLKKILLGLDYRAFVGYRKSKLSDFDSVFNKVNLYSHLFSLDTLKDSIVSLVDKKNTIVYKKGYAIKNTHKQREFDLGLGHLSITINTEKTYYKNQKFSYNYLDDKTNSIDDFTEILKICYKNDIELVIVINPNHIRLWESLDYHVGYDTWLKWKKDVVLQNDKVSKEFGKNPFEIYDFAIYNKFTS